MFVSTNPNKNQEYLIESNPAYTTLNNFIDSKYFYQKMGLDTDKLTKRLGDAAYETKLVTDAIINLTGRRIITQD